MGAVVTTLIIVVNSLFSMKPSDIVYWCKWMVSYIYIELSRCRSRRRFDFYDMLVEHDPYKVCFLPPKEEIELESPLPESQLQDTLDEVFFYGVNSKSECFVLRLARGPNNEAEALIHMKLADGRVYELKETGLQQSCTDKKAFTCGDLQLYYLSPLRRWRIFFNGVMREMSDDHKTPKKVYVKFSFIWKASSDAFDSTSDINTGDLATGLAKAEWNQYLPPLQKLHTALNFYSQSGVVVGNVFVEGMEDHNLYLFGERIRFLGNPNLMKGTEFYHILGWTAKDGRFVHVVETSIEDAVENLRFGFVVQPTGGIENISDAPNALEKLSGKGKENDIKTKFHADDKLFELQGSLLGEQIHLQSNKGWDGRMTIDSLQFQMNSLKGNGIVLRGKMMQPTKATILQQPVYSTSSVVPLVVPFSDKACQDPDVTGGKGSSLGKLTELSKDFQNFVVPSGIVVTTAAYKKFLTKEVLQDIKILEVCIYNNKGDDVKVACKRVVDEVIKSTIPDEVLQGVIRNLQKVFPNRNHSHKFAVRSSATGEDTEQMSAAGQMETYLGVAGISEIMSAVKKCWASQFSYIAVQYKRQNGQVINSPMAVVIQEMIPCDVAGVLFTCDPLTGNPTTISITANYGLGESVVSGLEEPDTIELKKSDDDKLVVKSKIIGKKSHRMVVKENDEGTNLEDVPEQERATCCITDDMAVRLGNLAVKIQKCCRSQRDIEWGFWNNNLYIFQSRPVTSGSGETDFEIEHEMDGPLRVENEFFTVCNVGEVMPGAMSPLGIEVLFKFYNIVFQRPGLVDFQDDDRTKYFPSGLCSMYNHVMFYCVNLFRHIDNKAATDSSCIAMFGRVLDNEEIFDVARMRHGNKKKTSGFKEIFTRLSQLFYLADKKLKHVQKTYANYRIEVEKYGTSQELFDALMYSCSDLSEIFACHMICSEASGMWNMIIFTILQNAKGGLNSDVYSDFALLLTTSSKVESADVPSALEELSSHISNDIKPEEFQKMDPNEAVRWLEGSTSVAGIKYKEFLMKHGHRCLREFDVRSSTWGTHPASLIPHLQSLVGSVKKDRSDHTNEDFQTLVSKLKIPLDFKLRLILRMLIPKSRRAVQDRESSKSMLIRGIDAWRKGYTRLSQLMMSEGRIPDEDLLFFMSLEEIKELLSTRSPRIIAKANHRRRRHPTLDKYIFPEITKGVPIPINIDNHPVISTDEHFSMKGIPVSQGVAKGYVRVAITLEEASLLQPDEILVTYATDIGWSPYFPILSGVVTELGGLISHGAVVSREYGLPCIAGLHGATRQFQTGDYVLLDGNKGILQRLPDPKNT